MPPPAREGRDTPKSNIGVLFDQALPGYSQYALRYSDDFNALSLRTGGPTLAGYLSGTGTWIPRCTCAGTDPKGYSFSPNGEYQWYTDPAYAWGGGYSANGQLSVAGGILTMRAETTPAGISASVPTNPNTGSTYSYVSGALSSQAYFTLVPPFAIEIRAKIPSGRSSWPALWLIRNDGLAPYDEIDILEAINSAAPGNLITSLHWDNPLTGISQVTPGPDLSSSFHLFAFWQDASGNMYWYLDNKLVWYRAKPTPWDLARPLYLMMNQAVGSTITNWALPPDGTTPSPQDFQVDYVKVYTP